MSISPSVSSHLVLHFCAVGILVGSERPPLEQRRSNIRKSESSWGCSTRAEALYPLAPPPLEVVGACWCPRGITRRSGHQAALPASATAPSWWSHLGERVLGSDASGSSALALWRGRRSMAAGPPLELGESVLHIYAPLILGDDVFFAPRAREGRDRCRRAAD